MKCSSTALPASTFVQRKNNKKIPQSLLNSLKLFFFFSSSSSFWRGGKTALDSLFVLLPCPFKGIQQPSYVVTREDLIFFPHDWKRRVCFWLLWVVIVKKREKRGAGDIFTGGFWSLDFFSCRGFFFHSLSYFWSKASFHFLDWAIKVLNFSLAGFFAGLFYTWVFLCYPDLNILPLVMT